MFLMKISLRAVIALGLLFPIFLSGCGGHDDGNPPRVVSAGSTSNTEVLVTFSKPMRGGVDGAETLDHYRISAPSLEGIVGGPIVLVKAAEFLDPDRTTVKLTTGSQSGIEYTLKVINVKDLAGNPIAAPDLFLDPSSVKFVGTSPVADKVMDNDKDGLTDADEQLGWVVTVHLGVGKQAVEVARYHVTSDPAVADTDGDGVSDKEEAHGGTDPRSPDTDLDTLTDDQEWNTIFSDPTNQDSDGDGVQDGVEYNTFRTSPILADTDGDQILDPDEVFAGNRNPLLADLPSPRIRVGNINLQLATHFTFTNEAGESVTENKTVESTLSRGENETFSTSNENSTKNTLEFSQELSGLDRGIGHFALMRPKKMSSEPR